MPFVCIAIVGLAIIYYAYLTVVQIFSGPRRDASSHKPVPPRALSGNYAMPVLGHTNLFLDVGGDIALLFPPNWKEWRYVPCSRAIGTVFSIFVWGKWRVVVNGPERVRRMMEEGDLRQSWAWHQPKDLLGEHCFQFLDEDKADTLRTMLCGPLSQANVIKLAPAFAIAAERCLEDIVDGSFDSRKMEQRRRKAKREEKRKRWRKQASGLDDDDMDLGHKVRWDALRSYTMDLVDGPVLGLGLYNRNDQRSYPSDSAAMFDEPDERFEDEFILEETDNTKKVRREMMLLWMERIKFGMCHIKMFLGAKWLQMWRFSAYERALYAQKGIRDVVAKHVDEREEQLFKVEPTDEAIGKPDMTQRHTSDASRSKSRPESGDALSVASSVVSVESNSTLGFQLPILNMTGELLKRRNVMMARGALQNLHRRSRSLSESDFADKTGGTGGSEDESLRVRLLPPNQHETVTRRQRAYTAPNLSPKAGLTIAGDHNNSTADGEGNDGEEDLADIPVREKQRSVLDQMLRAEDEYGNSMTKEATSEISILLWLMLEVGQAWTAMALQILAREPTAYDMVQKELTRLIDAYGEERLCTPFVMEKMVKMNALIYESMRMCPDFMGGLRTTNQTVEIDDVQIPKHSNIILCNYTDPKCNFQKAMHKKPENMGMMYPTEELGGFLPLEGLEVPLLVLQTKVFLITFLKNYRPMMAVKRTLIRRVHNVLSGSFHGSKQRCNSGDISLGSPTMMRGSFDMEMGGSGGMFEDEDEWAARENSLRSELPQRPMTIFPFPEPKKTILMKRVER